MKKKTYKYLVALLTKELQNAEQTIRRKTEDANTNAGIAERNAQKYFEVNEENQKLKLEIEFLKTTIEVLNIKCKTEGATNQ